MKVVKIYGPKECDPILVAKGRVKGVCDVESKQQEAELHYILLWGDLVLKIRR